MNCSFCCFCVQRGTRRSNKASEALGVFSGGLSQLLCREWDVFMSPKWRMIEWSGCNLLIMDYILRPLLWLHSISMDWGVITVCVSACERVCVRERNRQRLIESKIYSCHNFKCGLFLQLIIMSSPDVSPFSPGFYNNFDNELYEGAAMKCSPGVFSPVYHVEYLLIA